MNDLSTNPVTASTYVTYHTLTTSATGTVGMVISLQEGGPTNPCGITKVANLYASIQIALYQLLHPQPQQMPLPFITQSGLD